MKNYANGPEIPLGLGMALAQNRAAMNRFAALPAAEQQAFIERTRGVRSKEEMQSFVQSLLP